MVKYSILAGLGLLLCLTACYTTENTVPLTNSTPDSVTQPVPNDFSPDSFPIGDFPTELSMWNANNNGLFFLAESGTVRLYGVEQENAYGIILRIGDDWQYFPDQCWSTPRQIPPRLWSGDFDGDGAEEVAVSYYVGSGTGISYEELVVYETSAATWRSSVVTQADCETAVDTYVTDKYDQDSGTITLRAGSDSVSFSLSDLEQGAADSALPFSYQGFWFAPIVSYDCRDGALYASITVGLTVYEEQPFLTYPASCRLVVRAAYDGQAITLVDPALKPDD